MDVVETALLIPLIIIVVLATAFTLVVGGHDAPNAIALPVRARALTPLTALLLAAVMNILGVFLGVWLLSLASRQYLETVPDGASGLLVLGAALLVATAWDVLTWWRGVPTSSTHALAAGILGGAVALVLTGTTPMPGALIAGTLIFLVISMVFSPVIAAVVSWLLVFPILWWTKESSPGVVNQPARMGLALTGAANALGHGVQFGQRLYLMMAMALTAVGLEGLIGWWIPVAVAVLLGVGTLLGGWRIAHTMTERLVIMDPVRSSIASLTSAALLLLSSFAAQLPLSSSQTAVGAIVGAGAHQTHTAVRWPQVARIGLYFVLTLLTCGVLALILVAAATPLLG